MPRANDTNCANNRPVRIAIGRNYQRTAGIGKKLVLGANENLHALAMTCRVQKAQGIFARFKRIKQIPDQSKLVSGSDIIQQVGLTAHDQRGFIATFAIRPQPHPLFDQFGRQFIQLGAMFGDFLTNKFGGCIHVSASKTGGHIVAGSNKG